MVTIVVASFREGELVSAVRVRVEHPGVCASAGDALAFEIGDVPGQRRCPKPRATMTDDPRLDDHAPRGRAQIPGERSAAASAEAGAAARPARAEAAPTLSSPPRSSLDLADEATRVAVPNPSRPDSKIIVATGHRGRSPVKIPADGAATVDFLSFFVLSGSRAWAGADRKTQSNQPHAPRPTAVLLSRRPLVVFPCTPVRHSKMRQSPPDCDAAR